MVFYGIQVVGELYSQNNMQNLLSKLFARVQSLISSHSEISHRWHQLSEKDSINYLLNQAKIYGNKKNWKLLILGDISGNTIRFIKEINKSKLNYHYSNYEDFINGKLNALDISVIISLYGREDINYSIGQYLSIHRKYSHIPFEYTFIPSSNYQVLNKYDQIYYSSSYFVSPLLHNKGPVFKIYEESLKYFEKKCDIRDFLDLYQVISNIVSSGVKGDIVEFGSYKGHSSYLILKTLEHLKSTKSLYMYDTFKAFPKEKIGIDKFWSDTHEVNFSIIKSKFGKYKNVVIVRGDFSKTFTLNHPKNISLAYVDCDSYRATKYVIENVIDKYVTSRGYIVFEDYGHPALLGNRIAVSKFLDYNKKYFKFYSQFSGLYIIAKS